MEFAPANRKGFYGSWQMFAQAAGALLSTLVGALLFEVYTQAEIDSWAWRLPFLLGLLIGPVGLYIRRHLDEPAEFLAAERESVEFSVLWRSYLPQLIAGTAVSAAINVMSYVIVTYLPLYAVQSLGMKEGDAFVVLVAAIALQMALIPVFGILSDRVGRRTILITALLAFSATIYPAYNHVIAHSSVTALLFVECWFAVLIAAAYAPCPTYLSELFPVKVRATGLSISYNIAATVFGGFSIFIVTYIHQQTGSQLAPAHYAVTFFVLALIAVLFVGASEPDGKLAGAGGQT
jgi:MFS family permease